MTVAAAAAAAMLLSLPAGAESDDAIARLLAETASQNQPQPTKRAGKEHQVIPADRPRPEDERQLLDEIEMLERARAEAEARKAARSTADSADAADHEREEARRIAEERQKAEERQRIAAERKAEEDRRLAEEHRQAEERQRAEAARLAAETQRQVEEERQRGEDAEYARMEAEREAEAVRIDAALRKAREAWLQRQRARASDEQRAAADPEPMPAAPRERVSVAQDDFQPGHDAVARYDDAGDMLRSSTHVTILMVLEPGNRGIRRHNKTADPLLCGEKGCYVGTGAGSPADLLPRRRAFGASRTLGERAGACRNSLGCVFRGVDLVSYPAVVQPIDMRLLRHDRREPHVLNETSRCRLDGGRLACTPIVGPDYVMWVVPEQIAERAGARELARVVEAGLRSQSAAADIRD